MRGYRDRISGIMALCICLALTGCTKTGMVEADADSSGLGLVLSKEYVEDSKVLTLDGSLVKTGEKDYKIANLNLPANRSIEVGDSTFLIDIGNSDTREDGKVLEIDRKTGEETWYEFGRVNITAAAADEKYVYIVSNLNQDVFVDRMDRATGEVTTIEAENIITSIFLCGDQLTGIEIKGEDGESMCIVDFDQCICKSVTESKEELVPMMAGYENKIIYAAGEELYLYDTESGEVEVQAMNHGAIYSMQVVGEELYVVYGTIYDEGNAYVDRVDLRTMEAETIYEAEDPILQMEVVAEDSLMIADYDKVFLYDVEKGEAMASYDYSGDSEYYFAGFYLSENGQ